MSIWLREIQDLV